MEIIEAFTLKADGRKVPADARDFVTQAGSVGAAMSFVDLKVQQIPFRDLSVGDTAVVTVRVTESQHYIPNNYSRAFVLAPGPMQRTVDVTLRAPATLPAAQILDECYGPAATPGSAVRTAMSGRWLSIRA